MESMFNFILVASFWGSCLTVLFLLINKLFSKKLPFSWHYYIWLVVIMRLLVPAYITVAVEPNESSIIRQTENILHIEPSRNIISTTDYIENISATQTGNLQVYEPVILPSAEAVGANVFIKQIFRASNLWIIWLSVAAILIAYKLLLYFLYVQKMKGSCVSANENETKIFSQLMDSLNMRGKIAFFKNKGTQTPFVVGIFNLMVILPNRDYSNTQLTYILRHELTHIKRHDILVKWLYEIAKTIHWFNPFVYIAAKNASLYCEASCDAEVLKNKTTYERKEYSMILLDLIKQSINPKTPLCVSMHSNKSNLLKRIQYILNIGQNKKSIKIVIAAITLLLCACSSIQLQEISQSEQDAGMDTTKSEIRLISNTNDKPISIKEKTNILIAGLDDGGKSSRADTIIIASFDTKTNYTSLLSIPRDTYLLLSEATVSELKQKGVKIPSEIKFGELTAYTCSDGMEYLQKEITNTLGIHVDYYIKMDMSAFIKIVDAVGGVSMTIPDGGLYYNDPAQNLNISLNEGLQLLDGEKALMFVRYRFSYRNGDLDRIGVQQQFLKEIYSKSLNGNNLVEKATVLISVLTENTETNITFNDFASYLQYIPKINADNIQTFKLPVDVEQYNYSRSYVVIDNEEFERSIADVFRE